MKARNLSAAEGRREVLKQEIAAERVVSDAKTAKLRALRVAKEEADKAGKNGK
jgi:hypothetical protein